MRSRILLAAVLCLSSVSAADAEYIYRHRPTWFASGASAPVCPSTDSRCNGSTASLAAASCKQLHANGVAVTGVYWIKPGATPVQTTCDMTTLGGGWTMVMNNVANAATGMDLNATSVPGGGLTTAVSGTVAVGLFLDGSRELRWTVGNNEIVRVRENGAPYARKNIPTPGTATCPAASYRYDWITSASNGFTNAHSSYSYGCSGFGATGSNVTNFIASADCAACFSPVEAFFGNGSSGYYSYGNTYDYDTLWWNGQGYFVDVQPAFWSSSATHQLWIR